MSKSYIVLSGMLRKGGRGSKRDSHVQSALVWWQQQNPEERNSERNWKPNEVECGPVMKSDASWGNMKDFGFYQKGTGKPLRVLSRRVWPDQMGHKKEAILYAWFIMSMISSVL